MADVLKIGVLALQGAFSKHIEMLRSLGVDAVEVRKPQELEACDALIIPGGESTTMMRQIQYIDLAQKLASFAKQKPIFGTCAGLILMSRTILEDPLKPFGLIEMDVERNAFGRQADSFVTDLVLHLEARRTKNFAALFIRAPRIRNFSEQVEILAKLQEEPVLVKQGFHLAATFHPELTDDVTIHEYFIQLVKKSR